MRQKARRAIYMRKRACATKSGGKPRHSKKILDRNKTMGNYEIREMARKGKNKEPEKALRGTDRKDKDERMKDKG